MHDNSSRVPGVHVGVSSLLTVFLVLCLVTFAVLSVAAARSDYSFSERAADRKTAYYQASNQAEDILDGLDALLAAQYGAAGEGYWPAIQSALEDYSAGNVTLRKELTGSEPVISYQVPLDDRQVLSVSLAIDPSPRPDSGFYRILSWQVRNTADWQSDDTLHLMPIG